MIAATILFLTISPATPPADAPVTATAPKPPAMPITGLAPSKVVEGLCLFHYSVATRSAECQTHCDQGYGYFYSYVWMEAARSFETALRADPNCASAWLGLSRALEKWGRSAVPKADPFYAVAGVVWQPNLPEFYSKSPTDYALGQARKLMSKASHRERLLITAKLQEKGMWPDVKPDDRRKRATQTLDELLTLYEDDEEGWFARAQIAEGQYGAAPFYKSLLKVNPLHPGANHELVHFFENIRRPALGWPYAEKYMESSPKIPHAFHMQAHLATRVGKWVDTTNWSAKAYRLEKEYHQFLGVKPSEDHQFQHHTETLTRTLLHDGRFAELDAVKTEAIAYGYKFTPEWFRSAVTKKDWPAVEKYVEETRKRDKLGGAYYGAVMALEKGDLERAKAEVQILQQSQQKKRNNGTAELRLWEVLGRLECQQGNGEAGCKLLRRVIAKTKDDFNHHAWGNGAVYMETWGIAALEGGVASEAEEAFQEALAHDAGSVRGALGLWALCDRMGRFDEANRYLKVAKRCWARALPADFEMLKNDIRAKADRVPTSSNSTSSEQ
ncbi:MAG: hypothetical protein U0798_06800 [Gemmataceae bacterium]